MFCFLVTATSVLIAMIVFLVIFIDLQTLQQILFFFFFGPYLAHIFHTVYLIEFLS